MYNHHNVRKISPSLILLKKIRVFMIVAINNMIGLICLWRKCRNLDFMIVILLIDILVIIFTISSLLSSSISLEELKENFKSQRIILILFGLLNFSILNTSFFFILYLILSICFMICIKSEISINYSIVLSIYAIYFLTVSTIYRRSLLNQDHVTCLIMIEILIIIHIGILFYMKYFNSEIEEEIKV